MWVLQCCPTTGPTSSVGLRTRAGQATGKGCSTSPLAFPFNVQWASVCLHYFQFLNLLSKLWRQALFSSLAQRGNTNLCMLRPYAGHHPCGPRALQQRAEHWVTQQDALQNFCVPHCYHSQNLSCHWEHAGHGTKRIVSSRGFNGWENITLCTVAQARSFWITSEHEESQTTEIWITTEKKQELLLLAVIPYLPNKWPLFTFSYRD